MKKIAILSTMYYPDMGAPSSVIDRFVQRLSEKYDIYIITKTFKSVDEFEPKPNIFYIDGVRHRLTLLCERNIHAEKLVLLSKICLKCIDAYKLILTQFCHPTANSWEVTAYYKQLKKLNEKVHLDVVISVSNTAFAQFATNKFKIEYCNVRWVQFITDPFPEFYIYYRYKMFPKLWRRINERDERNFYKNCDAAFLTPELINNIKRKFPESAKKCHQMQFTLTDLSSYKKSIKKRHKNIMLIYAGAVYRDIRNPEFMMHVISQIVDVHLDMYTNMGDNRGECDDIIKNNLSDNIDIHRFVPKDRYNEMICNEYDILVNIGNVSDLQTPSKMLDLLSTGRPILNFYFVKDSQFYMIERYPLGLNICCGDENAIEHVSDFCRNMRGKSMSFDEVKALYPENAIEYQVELFENLINPQNEDSNFDVNI